MLSQENNELLIRVGSGTPMGQLIRNYWIPASFTENVAAPNSPPVRVRLLGEDLVLFRDSEGRLGLLEEACPHRLASMFYGRNEGGGLRCVYHGLKFDVNGSCVDVPCVPRSTSPEQLAQIKQSMKTKSYPCIERAGLVWTFMGDGAPPPFPELEWTLLPEAQRYTTRHIQECNWLQALEGGFDAPHLTFLHGGDHKDRTRDVVPSFYEVAQTDFGFVVATGREIVPEVVHWNLNVMLMPFHKIISTAPAAAHMWVPIDDETTMLYSIDFHPDRPLSESELMRARDGDWIHTENAPGTDYALRNRGNEYMIDRALQASGASFTGIKGFGTQDCAVQESMGPIVNRSRERLLVGDSAIVKLRRLLLQTLRDQKNGVRPLGLDPGSYRVRSLRCELPPDANMSKLMQDLVRVDRKPAEVV
jgi:phthalate 4,5-dioxygenase oxygenase subunit